MNTASKIVKEFDGLKKSDYKNGQHTDAESYVYFLFT